ncbi:MAG: EamA family transporter [Candidatus Omnitrophica bacterium]|nr:EamA family transporter [Candidatus Omnitrophota bacterium]
MARQGFIYALIVMICWGLAPIFAKAGLAKLPLMTAIVFRNTFIAIIFLSAFLMSGQLKTLSTCNMGSVFLILIEALLAGLIGQYFYYKAVKVWEASRVVPIVGAYPLVSFIIAVLVLSEKVTLAKSLGVVFVVIGVGLLGI